MKTKKKILHDRPYFRKWSQEEKGIIEKIQHHLAIFIPWPSSATGHKLSIDLSESIYEIAKYGEWKPRIDDHGNPIPWVVPWPKVPEDLDATYQKGFEEGVKSGKVLGQMKDL